MVALPKGEAGILSLAARFAAKEAFGKALGTGLHGFSLKEIAVMNDELGKLNYLKRISFLTLRIIKQNIFVALGLKFVFLALAVPGLATLWMAVFADMGASLLVIFNGLRTLR